ncbi:MAG TPA: M28 family peptidase, partial [Armatimonadota bacterium]|nr:M28 family peptidase [Armatimonadota bacterium]
ARISGILVHDYGTGKVNNISLQGQWACGPILDEITRPLRAVGFEGVRAGSLGGTDHLSFISAGVPGFACYQDPAEYRKTHHSPSDTLDKVWPDDLKEGAMVLAVWAYNVAGLPELLPRTEGRRQG